MIILRSVAILVAMLFSSSFVYARRVIDASDQLKPRWCEHVDETGRLRNSKTGEYTYEYKPIRSVGMDLSPLKANRPLKLKEYFQSTYRIEGDSKTEYTHLNANGKTSDTDSYTITFRTISSSEEFECVFIDDYWERYDDGEYVLYSLYAVSIPGVKPHFDDFKTTTDYPWHSGVVRSLVPGWGQIYKGSKVKGGLIIAAEAIGVGGIVTSYSMKSSYEKLMQEDPKHLKEYSMSADMWQNIGYGCIAFTAAVYIYNLIDAAIAPGARRVIVYPREKTFTIAPSVMNDGSIGIAMKYNF